MKTPQFTAQLSLGNTSNLRTAYRTFNKSIFTGVAAMEQSEITSPKESQDSNHISVLIPQQTSQQYVQAPPQTVDMMSPTFIYGIGQIKGLFPSLEVEKEFAQAVGRAGTASLTDQQTLYTVLSKPENRYLIRQLCWVFLINGMETYLLQPRDPADFGLLVEAINPDQGTGDMDVVIGILGPIAPAEMCNGLMIPIVIFDQIYSFTRDAFMAAVPRPDSIKKNQDAQFRAAVREVFDRILQIADNTGATEKTRATDYLAVRYSAIYTQAALCFLENMSLTGIQVNRSSISNTRVIMEVIFSYTNRQTNVMSMYCASVDVTGEFPFLVKPLSPYFVR
jgi:hypothetical protein